MFVRPLLALAVPAVAVQAFSVSDVTSFARDVTSSIGGVVKRHDGHHGGHHEDHNEGPVTPARGLGECPSVWKDVSDDLTAIFLGDNGECTALARGAIRAAFHDCFPGAGCDGSLILGNEFTNFQNRGIPPIAEALKPIAEDREVGYADLIQFAAAHAVATCPMGPRIPAKVGRTDSDVAAPGTELPTPFQNASELIPMFEAKGFSAGELAALIGAHTASVQTTVDPENVASQDTTPGKFDNLYYKQTIEGNAPFTFQSDRSLAHDDQRTAGPMQGFANSQGGWNAAFTAAMVKMSLRGVENPGELVDCSEYLPRGTAPRNVRAAPINDRVRI
ncbi:heme peroxidase [Lineolata rhizophorae]|uniref:Peroxidase n=1 Tax=Lineolata rhizophorae TaxID=578093 RepID=A0A6A6NP59_9PEZI|nr:heme peroxidase [Lineolata rhizophorae]